MTNIYLSVTYQHRPATLDCLDLERAEKGPGTAPAAKTLVNEELLDGAAKGPRLGVRHAEHDDAHDVGPLGARPGLGLVEQDEDQALAVVDLGDALLPPGEQLLVRQRRQESGDCAVVGDARGVDGGQVRDEVAMLGRREDGHGPGVGHGGAGGGETNLADFFPSCLVLL